LFVSPLVKPVRSCRGLKAYLHQPRLDQSSEVSLNEFEPAKICYLLETLEQLVEDLKLSTGSPGSSGG
jgi:hypothetical protein